MRSLFHFPLILCSSEWYLFSYELDIHSNRRPSAYDARLSHRETRSLDTSSLRENLTRGFLRPRKVRNLYDCGYIPAAWLKGAIHYRLAAVSSKAEIQIGALAWDSWSGVSCSGTFHTSSYSSLRATPRYRIFEGTARIVCVCVYKRARLLRRRGVRNLYPRFTAPLFYFFSVLQFPRTIFQTYHETEESCDCFVRFQTRGLFGNLLVTSKKESTRSRLKLNGRH